MCLTAPGSGHRKSIHNQKDMKSLTVTLPIRRGNVEQLRPFISPKAKHSEHIVCNGVDTGDPYQPGIPLTHHPHLLCSMPLLIKVVQDHL